MPNGTLRPHCDSPNIVFPPTVRVKIAYRMIVSRGGGSPEILVSDSIATLAYTFPTSIRCPHFSLFLKRDVKEEREEGGGEGKGGRRKREGRREGEGMERGKERGGREGDGRKR